MKKMLIFKKNNEPPPAYSYTNRYLQAEKVNAQSEQKTEFNRNLTKCP